MADFSKLEKDIDETLKALNRLPPDPEWLLRYEEASIRFRMIVYPLADENFVCTETLIAIADILLVFSELLQPPHIYEESCERAHAVAYLEKVANFLKEDGFKILKPQKEKK